MFQTYAYTTTNTMPVQAASTDVVGLAQQFPEFHNRVRFDADTKRGSVLDVIQLMTEQLPSNCSRTLRTLEASNPELTNRFQKTRINNRVFRDNN
jgi:hypothetical protein